MIQTEFSLPSHPPPFFDLLLPPTSNPCARFQMGSYTNLRTLTWFVTGWRSRTRCRIFAILFSQTMLQCVAVCCSVLQRVAVCGSGFRMPYFCKSFFRKCCCSVSQCVWFAVDCGALRMPYLRKSLFTNNTVVCCCSMLQCLGVAVCYIVLQCATVCRSVLQCVAVCYSVSQCATVCRSVLQCVAVCHSVLQCATVCRSVP